MAHSQAGHSEDCGSCSELYEKPLEASGERVCILKESPWWLYKKRQWVWGGRKEAEGLFGD